jgi:hypothetical protein
LVSSSKREREREREKERCGEKGESNHKFWKSNNQNSEKVKK